LKRTIFLSALLILLLLNVKAYAGMDDSWHFVLNKDDLFLNTQPIIENGRVLVSINDISEKQNFQYKLLLDKNKVIILKDKIEIKFTLGEKKAILNSKVCELDVAPVLQAKKIFVPLRFVSEALGYNVHYHKWTGYTPMVWVTKFNILTDIKRENYIEFPTDGLPIYKLEKTKTTAKNVRLGDNIEKVKKVYGVPAREELDNNNTGYIIYTTVFLPETGSGTRLNFTFENGILKEVSFCEGT